MKIPCTVFGRQATVVGYFQGRKGKPRAVVIAGGKLKDVALRHIVLHPATYTYEVTVSPEDAERIRKQLH
jgi:hypothetical protein